MSEIHYKTYFPESVNSGQVLVKALVQIRLYKVLKIINFDFVKIGLLGMGYPK